MAFDDPGSGGAPGAKKNPPNPSLPSAPWGPPPVTPPQPPSPGTPPSTNTPPFPGIPGVLSTDPAYQQLLAFDTAAGGEDLAIMNANIAKMQAYYGSDNDPLSILGRVFQAYKDRNMTIANTLAGHGMIASGETGWQGARATLAYQQQELDARFKLQAYIDSLNQAYAQAQRQMKFNELQASWNAVNNWLTGNPPVTTPGTEPSPAAPATPWATPGVLGTPAFTPPAGTPGLGFYGKGW